MARKQAGRRYPHITTDARPHNHRMCPVVQAVADRAAAGAEPWGTRHDMPPVPSETVAKRVKSAFYASRYCRELTARYGEPLSVQADFDQLSNGQCVVWLRIWPRSVARAEIARRVKAKEPLAYNVLKGPQLCSAPNAVSIITRASVKPKRSPTVR